VVEKGYLRDEHIVCDVLWIERVVGAFLPHILGKDEYGVEG
jgi:hypothetical protein